MHWLNGILAICTCSHSLCCWSMFTTKFGIAHSGCLIHVHFVPEVARSGVYQCLCKERCCESTPRAFVDFIEPAEVGDEQLSLPQCVELTLGWWGERSDGSIHTKFMLHNILLNPRAGARSVGTESTSVESTSKTT